MSVFKVVSRNPDTGRQLKKKIYVGDAYKKYAQDLINRWSEWSDVEVYEMKDEEYRLWYEVKMPRTIEDLEKMAQERGWNDTWLTFRKNELNAAKKEQ